MPSNTALQEREQHHTNMVMPLFVMAVLSGIATWPFSGAATWVQLSWLFHTFLGVLLSIVILPYLWVHIRRTFNLRRKSVFTSGVFSVLVSLIALGSGWWLFIVGQTEQTRWVLRCHQLSILTFLMLIVVHILVHIKTIPKNRVNKGVFNSIANNAWRWCGGVIGGTACLFGLILTSVLVSEDTPSGEPIVKNYEYPYGEGHFLPSLTTTWNNQFVEESQIARSEDCIACHQEIAEEWASSVHRQAASDPSYVKNISLLVAKKGIAAARYCEGCHAPVALLTGQLSPGGKHGGEKGTAAFHEGVGCLGCHGIESVVSLDGVASFNFKPPVDYLFSGENGVISTKINHMLIQARPELHREQMARPILDSPKLCATCHVQFMDISMNNWGWIKMQDEYTAWLESPYSHHHKKNFSNSEQKDCNDCHMQKVSGDDPSGDTLAKHHSHRFLAANTVLPLLAGDTKQLQLTKHFLQNNKVHITINKPQRDISTQTREFINEGIRTKTETPYFGVLGETLEFEVVVSNVGVGHDFPGGTTDINEVWIDFLVQDATGKIVYQSGAVDETFTVDEAAIFYRSMPIDKAGNLLWKHDLFNRVGLASKNVIPSGESDLVKYPVKLPMWIKGPISITATLKYRKFNEKYARWALNDRYQPIPIVDMAYDSLLVPIKIKQEVETAVLN